MSAVHSQSMSTGVVARVSAYCLSADNSGCIDEIFAPLDCRIR